MNHIIWRKCAIASAVALVVFFSLDATAADHVSTGNYIIDGWNVLAATMPGPKIDDITQNKAPECLGAIHGVASIGSVLHQICIAEHVTYGQMGKVVSKYMNDHLDQLNWDYSALIYNALRSTWPWQSGLSFQPRETMNRAPPPCQLDRKRANDCLGAQSRRNA